MSGGLENLETILAKGWHTVYVTEVRANPQVCRRMAKRFGYHAIMGGEDSAGLIWVAVFTKGEHRQLSPQQAGWCPPEWRHRIVAARQAMGNTDVWMAAVYGKTGPSQAEKAELNQLLMGLTEELASKGVKLALVAGDFNCEVMDLAVTELWGRAGWRDLGTGGTCQCHHSQRIRRLDWVWASHRFAGHCGPVDISWGEGLPTHAVQSWQVQLAKGPESPHWILGDVADPEGARQLTEEDWQEAWRERRDEFHRHMEHGQIDQAWAVLKQGLLEMHQRVNPGFRDPKARIQMRPEELPTGFEGDEHAGEVRVATKRKRLLQHWHALVGRQGYELQVNHIKKALLKDPEVEWAMWGWLRPGKEQLQAAIEAAREAEDAVRAKLRESRRDKWHEWCIGGTERGMRNLFRWVREGPKALTHLGLREREDGTVSSGKLALLEESEKKWWPLWQQPQTTQAEPAKFQRFGEQQLSRITGRRLQNLVKGASAMKAPGEDGWSFRRLKGWPAGVFEELAGLMRKAEQCCRWPQEWTGGVICLLPKAGKQAGVEDPLQARPVVLMSIYYRMWAALRTKDTVQWLEENQLGAVDMQDGPAVSCEDLATVAAGLLEAARVHQEEGYVLGLDLSKAYDRVPVRVLESLMRDSGLHPSLAMLVGQQTASARRIKVLNVAGGERLPCRGIVPGCPLATHLMGLLLNRWRTHTRNYVVQGLCRTWVDDSTVGSRGEGSLGAIVAGMAAMEQIVATDELQVNEDKSAAVAASQKSRAKLQGWLDSRSEWPQGGVILCLGPGSHRRVDEVAGLLQIKACQQTKEVSLEEGQDTAVHIQATVVVSEGPPHEPGRRLLEAQGGEWVTVEQLQSEECVARLRSKLQAASHRVRLKLQAKEALKDLGVAIGLAGGAADMQAKRLLELVQRVQRVGQLGLPMEKLSRLIQASALPAGLHGCAAGPPDSDTFKQLRKWVRHALYKGSAFAQDHLLFGLELIPRRADPLCHWLGKAVKAVQTLKAVHQEGFARVWYNSHAAGPLAGAKKVLSGIGLRIEADKWSREGASCKPFEDPAESIKAFLHSSVRHWDLAKASERKGQGNVVSVDVPEVHRLLRKLPKRGLQEALKGVYGGDAVCRMDTRHYQQHDGRCQCGHEKETLQHVWWRCPLYEEQRLGEERHRPGTQAREPQEIQGKLGLPLIPARVAAWRSAWVPTQQGEMGWQAAVVCTDASALHPKDPTIRAVGWSVVGKVQGTFKQYNGTAPPGSSVGEGEAQAVVAAYDMVSEGGSIYTDCQAVAKLWGRAPNPQTRSGGALGRYAEIFARLRRERPDVQVHWIPSHLTEESFGRHMPGPLGQEVWEGNGEADARAKEAAARASPEGEVVAEYKQAQARNWAIANTVAHIQLARLRTRIRTNGGRAAKTRERREPGLPRRLRRPKRKRFAQPINQQWRAEELVHRCRRENLPGRVLQDAGGQGVGSAVWHDLRPVGPWPARGSVASTNGRFQWTWYCLECGKTAKDSTRAAQLLRKPCKGGFEVSERSQHLIVEGARGIQCGRCGLATDPRHRNTTSRQQCPVPAVVGEGGQPRPEEERAFQALQGRLAAFRQWCCQAEPDGVEDPRRQNHGLVAKCCRQWWCLECGRNDPSKEVLMGGQCGGALPLAPSLRRLLKRREYPDRGSPEAHGRWRELRCVVLQPSPADAGGQAGVEDPA